MKSLICILVFGFSLLLNNNSARSDHSELYSYPLDLKDNLIVFCKMHRSRDYRASKITHEELIKKLYKKVHKDWSCKYAISERHHNSLYISAGNKFKPKKTKIDSGLASWTNYETLKELFKSHNKKINFNHSEFSLNNDYALYRKLYPTKELAAFKKKDVSQAKTSSKKVEKKTTKVKKNSNTKKISEKKIEDDSQIIVFKNCGFPHPHMSHVNELIDFEIDLDKKNIKIYPEEWDDVKLIFQGGSINSGIKFRQQPFASDDKYSYADYVFIPQNGKIDVTAYLSGLFSKKTKYDDFPSQFMDMKCDTDFAGTSGSSTNISFNIKQKREQCEAIGFEPETEKFADCVLRLVELDVKNQQNNKIVSAESSGNQALVDELKKQRDFESTQYLLNLGKELRNPQTTNSNIYMPQTQRCTIQGFGTFAKMVCR